MSPVALLRGVAAATTFLTRVPIGDRLQVEAEDIARAGWAFPLVGAVVGLAVGGAAHGLAHVLPAWLAGMLAVALGVLLTGAMHHDGLADAADALGGWTRERSLEIMRDHAVGTYGTLALVLVVLVDVAAIGELSGAADVALVVASAYACGRAAMLPLALLLPYARADGGQGRVLAGMGAGRAVVGVVAAAAVAAVAGLEALWGLLAVAVAALSLGLLFRRWLGGVTGDLLGTVAKLGESTFLVTLVAVRR